MTLEELVHRVRTQDALALDGLAPQQAAAVVRAVLQTVRSVVEAAPVDVAAERVLIPELGRARPPQVAGRPWVLVLDPPRQGRGVAEGAMRAGSAPVPRPPARMGMEPLLIHPEHRFGLIFSPKSACSSVVIWFFHTLGLLDQARAHSEWPHDYRIDQLNRSAQQQQARQLPLEALKILRVVRDPLERAASSFRHALGTHYARQQILAKIGVDVHLEGLSFQRFIDFLETENLDTCNPHHRRQKHPVESLQPPYKLINVTRQDLFTELNVFERAMGMPVTDFSRLHWIHELQATRVPKSVDMGPEADTITLTQSQAQRGPWPKGLLTDRARARLLALYAEDVALYA